MEDYVYIVTAEELKEQTTIMGTVSEKYINPIIKKAQDQYLSTILGEKLLFALYDRYREDNLLGYYKELYELCKYYVTAKTLSDLTMTLSYKLAQVGLAKGASDGIEIASYSEIVSLKDYYQKDADFACMRIQNHLKKYWKEFPELVMDGRYDIPEEIHSFSSCGLFLGNHKGKKLI